MGKQALGNGKWETGTGNRNRGNTQGAGQRIQELQQEQTPKQEQDARTLNRRPSAGWQPHDRAQTHELGSFDILQSQMLGDLKRKLKLLGALRENWGFLLTNLKKMGWKK